MSIIVSPSILSANFAKLENDIKRVEKAGADWLHIDVMDGHFVSNITIGIPVVKSIKKVTNLPLDVHLMISNPENYVEKFVEAGADILTFHVEAMKNVYDIRSLIRKIKSLGVKVGISIKPKTPAAAVFQFLYEVDLVLVMTVEPGFGGQDFILDCAEKIKPIRNFAPKDLIIQVDGGINAETAKICIQNGANSLVAGSYIYGSKNAGKAISCLKSN